MGAAVSSSPRRRVVIACYGGLGREVAGWLKAYEPETEFLGFIDDSRPHDCLGPIDRHRPIPGATYLVANGRGEDRLRIAELLGARGARMGSLVSPQATLGTALTDEDQVILLGRASVSIDVRIGRQTLIQELAVIGHDVSIGPACTVGALAFLGGGVTLGKCVTVYPHVTVIPKVVVGDGATLGAGSVVLGPVAAGATVFGSPARPVP